MKVLGINGSPKGRGNTYLALKVVLEALEKEGFEAEIFHIGGRPVRGCIDCKKCVENKDMKCVIDDFVNEAIAKTVEANVVIIGSPVYFSNVTPEIKAYIDRAGRVARANDFAFKNKIGSAVAVARRSGKNSVIAEINYLFMVEQMIIPGSTYWNGLVGANPGDVLNDKEGIANLKILAKNIAWLAKKVY